MESQLTYCDKKNRTVETIEWERWRERRRKTIPQSNDIFGIMLLPYLTFGTERNANENTPMETASSCFYCSVKFSHTNVCPLFKCCYVCVPIFLFSMFPHRRFHHHIHHNHLHQSHHRLCHITTSIHEKWQNNCAPEGRGVHARIKKIIFEDLHSGKTVNEQNYSYIIETLTHSGWFTNHELNSLINNLILDFIGFRKEYNSKKSTRKNGLGCVDSSVLCILLVKLVVRFLSLSLSPSRSFSCPPTH